MAKNKDEVEIDVMESTPVPVTQIFVRAPREKVYSFEQWARLRSKLDHHLGGLKAFLGELAGNRYPLEKWDEIMKSY